jgi:hypothetical protein
MRVVYLILLRRCEHPCSQPHAKVTLERTFESFVPPYCGGVRLHLFYDDRAIGIFQGMYTYNVNIKL